VVAVVSFGYEEGGRVNRVFIMRNPEKLGLLGSGSLA
ncbi:RNA polymerase subunit sigma-24, partial [Pseudomonas sp. FW305-25]